MRCSKRCACRRASLLKCVFCVFFVVSVQEASAQSLDDAYKAELVRLEAEEGALRGALRKAQSRAKRARAGLVSEIEGLSKTLTRLRADNSAQKAPVAQVERLHSFTNQSRTIERRQVQIETWLETHDVRVDEGNAGGDGEAVSSHSHPPLDVMIAAALDHIEEHGQLRLQAEHEYFDAEGIAKRGAVLHIAEVGALAVDDGFLPLDLAPDGSLRVNPRLSAERILHGDSQSVGVVLFDPDDIRPLRIEADGWRAWMDKGGDVMWAIAALALLAALLFLERMIAFVIFASRIAAAKRRGPRASIADSDRLLAPIASAQRGSGDSQAVEAQAVEAMLQVQPVVRRGISLLAVVAAVAPLLGLLGTVTGMIGTFAVITEHGTGDPRLLSGGISAALLTTQFGLMVAIPALLMQTTLYRSGDMLLRRIERLTMEALSVRFDAAAPARALDNIIAVQSER